jgi:hypothetical protein
MRRKHMRKLISIILTILICFSFVPQSTSEAAAGATEAGAISAGRLYSKATLQTGMSSFTKTYNRR